MKEKIHYHHTDCGGVVYYANYLDFFEEARTEFFADKGFSVGEMAKQGILFVVARQEIDYKAPAFYGDTLEVTATMLSASGVKFEFGQEVKNQDNKLICLGRTILVCVDKNFRPQAIPDNIRTALLK
ncbi:MAG: acyl-CoA thioesterase [Candidatus Omnitrophota bacterium]|jgi:acyl-CoA thioester hydrolase|nr:MAG: acyl-CoA thioesterase [Candidatus Omnitrophota bacterium]